MSKLRLDLCVIRVSSRERSNALYQRAPGAEVVSSGTNLYACYPDGSFLEFISYTKV